MAVGAHRRATTAAVVIIATTVAAATALAFFAYFIQLEQIYFSFCFSFRHYLLFRIIGDDDDDVDDNDGVLYFLHPATYWSWSGAFVLARCFFFSHFRMLNYMYRDTRNAKKIICNNDTRPPHRATLFADAHFHYYFVQFFPSSSSSSALLLFYSIHDRLNIMPFAMHYITMHSAHGTERLSRDKTKWKYKTQMFFVQTRTRHEANEKIKYEKRFVFLQLMCRVSVCVCVRERVCVSVDIIITYFYLPFTLTDHLFFVIRSSFRYLDCINNWNYNWTYGEEDVEKEVVLSRGIYLPFARYI